MKFKHSKLNTEVKNSNHRKKYYELEMATTVYRICIYNNITYLKLVTLVSSVLYRQLVK